MTSLPERATPPSTEAVAPDESCPSLSAKAPLPIVRLWCLRLLVRAEGHRRFIQPTGYSASELAAAIGLVARVPDDRGEFRPAHALAELRLLHAEAERDAAAMRLPALFADTLGRLAQAVGLEPLDVQLLAFAVLLHADNALDDAGDQLGGLTVARMHRVLALVLGVAESAVRHALRPDGGLARSALLSVDATAVMCLQSKLDLISGNFAELIQAGLVDPMALLRGRLVRCAPPRLGLADFAYLPVVGSVLLPYVRTVVTQRRVGANVLLYGPPGVGKTELARLLAAELGCALYEVANCDDHGFALGGAARLRAYRAAQQFLHGQHNLLLFDEVEDVFESEPGHYGKPAPSKAWINRTLESSLVPTVWITNSLENLDPAMVRRFAVVLQVSGPPREAREAMVAGLAGHLARPETIAMLAASEAVTPAVISSACGVLALVGADMTAEARDRALRTLVVETVAAQTRQPFELAPARPIPLTYDAAAFLNADHDLASLVHGLRARRAARLCLYGPPGTGKTQFAHWLAQELGMPLQVERASDLLGAYVSQTEIKIARAFARAQANRSLLLIDEADTLIFNRDEVAVRSWEFSQVGEMLVQMEAFDGVFIATTNRELDPAAARRFDLKVRLSPLRGEQAAGLLARHCAALGLGVPDEASAARVAQLPGLTPGDYAAVARRHAFSPVPSVAAFVDALARECGFKQAVRAPIGFVNGGRA
jgi:SpoVK/Ycf46/Vps4 family AAA+-type ATPase